MCLASRHPLSPSPSLRPPGRGKLQVKSAEFARCTTHYSNKICAFDTHWWIYVLRSFLPSPSQSAAAAASWLLRFALRSVETTLKVDGVRRRGETLIIPTPLPPSPSLSETPPPPPPPLRTERAPSPSKPREKEKEESAYFSPRRHRRRRPLSPPTREGRRGKVKLLGRIFPGHAIRGNFAADLFEAFSETLGRRRVSCA